MLDFKISDSCVGLNNKNKWGSINA